MSVCGCLSRLSLCGPVMDWQPVQGVPHLSPDDRWDRLQPPRDPTDGLSEYRKWMDVSFRTKYIKINTHPELWRLNPTERSNFYHFSARDLLVGDV